MLLSEILDSGKTLDGSWSRGKEIYQVTFPAGDRDIQATFAKQPRQGEHWDFDFEEQKQTGSAVKKSLDVTGSGKEFEVFGQIVSILKSFIQDNNPDSISFTAEKSDKNRARLYQRMVDKLLPLGWKQDTDHKGSDYRSYFTIMKA